MLCIVAIKMKEISAELWYIEFDFLREAFIKFIELRKYFLFIIAGI